LLCDEEHASDSAGTGGASIPNHLHHPTSNLWIEGAFILDIFRQTPEVSCTSNTGTECFFSFLSWWYRGLNSGLTLARQVWYRMLKEEKKAYLY
jgi:hypothetical protein